MKRGSGVLMPVSSLWGTYGIGGFSRHAKEFIDFLADCGFSYWQVLPFTMTDEFNSPYKSFSAFGGNPYFIDLEQLKEEGLLTEEELLSQVQQTPYQCEYARLQETRRFILNKASGRAKNRTEIEGFTGEKPYLEQCCQFLARKDANDQKCWIEWERDSFDPEQLFFWRFVQFTFFRQWQGIKTYANRKGIQVIGDIPFYVAYDSADVWGNRRLFQLYDDGRIKRVAGVPPDYFSADGQLWGNPLYDWSAMEETNYAWWRNRMAHMLSLFDGVRIDHFRGMDSYWSVPAEARTAREGRWENGPGKKLVDALRQITQGRLVVAEDLGNITDSVRTLVNDSGFPGMRVLQFGFLDGRDSFHRPHHYPENCVAYTGTHDNNTLLGYLWELEEPRRRELMGYCGFNGHWNESYDSILQRMLESRANLVLFPIQDLLHFGADTRLNYPGRAEGNWGFRVTQEQIESLDRRKFKEWNTKSGR